MRRTHIALRGSLFTLLMLCAGLAGPLGSQVRSAHAEEAILINVGEEDLLIEDFLRTVSRATGVNILWNPADKNIRGKKIIGSVTLEAKASEFLGLARSLLTFYELVMIPVGPVGSQVMLVVDARQSSSILKMSPENVTLTPDNLAHYEHAEGLFITTAVQMEHMRDLRNARNALTRLVTGQNIGNVTEVPEANAFIVTDFAPNVVSVYRLLKEMDVPGASPSTTSGQTVAITLEYGSAQEMAGVLQEHFSLRTQPQAAPRAANQAPDSSPNAPRITADARTNMILVTGSDEQITKVKDVITRLDVGLERPTSRAHYVHLAYIGAIEAAATLSRFANTSPELWGQGGSPTIVAHDETNALLISCSKAAFEQLTALISDMDVAPKTPVDTGGGHPEGGAPEGTK